MIIQHGMEVFNLHCASCHDFAENGIGPNLSGITSEVEKEWLVSFIKNPPAMIEGGDERAVALFEKYKSYMPPFPTLDEDEIEDVLSFVHKFSEGEKRNKNNRSGGILNPVSEKITTSDITLLLAEQFIVPASSEAAPISRINQMGTTASGRLFIHDLRGPLYEIKNDTELSLYIDLSKNLENFIDNPGKGAGFASWAFHPDFDNNGLFYATHSEPANSAQADFEMPDSIKVAMQFVLTEWKTDNPKAEVFSGSHRELLRVDMASGAHTFQQIAFNPLAKRNTPDYGLLYLGIGDAGTALRGYTFLCDNFTKIWSKVLRINPLGHNSTNGNYGIPVDNPFVNEAEALPEIWASGFRNPHRFCWDETGSGKMLITNIGQHSLEEVNLGIAGADYGWPYREGTFLFDPSANPELVYPLPADDHGYTYPVIQYDHDEGSAVSGGFVYSGKSMPMLRGKYIFGDISRGMLFYSEVSDIVDGQQAPIYRLKVAIDGKATDNMESITGSKRVDLRIGQDSEGEIYIFSKANGAVYKVVDHLDGTKTSPEL